MRMPLIAGNWKMHLTLHEAVELAKAVAAAAEQYSDREVLLYPTFLQFTRVQEAVTGSKVLLGAQNCSAEKDGAFTGEISAAQLRDAGAQYVLIGHSERRHILGEKDDFLKKKIDRVLEQNLKPMLCVGETLSEREAGRAKEVVLNQLLAALQHLHENEWRQITIAYEPVWAIGTGKNATPEDAQRMHSTIRSKISALCPSVAQTVRILYGGSVKPDNIAALMAMPDIDGVLVGGASLKAESFIAILRDAVV
ncbi:MAG: triose-phosphate isomerase [Turneriella sp.]|nr:triose-phosphate isomerase [Turneriella sp.]